MHLFFSCCNDFSDGCWLDRHAACPGRPSWRTFRSWTIYRSCCWICRCCSSDQDWSSFLSDFRYPIRCFRSCRNRGIHSVGRSCSIYPMMISCRFCSDLSLHPPAHSGLLMKRLHIVRSKASAVLRKKQHPRHFGGNAHRISITISRWYEAYTSRASTNARHRCCHPPGEMMQNAA